MLYIDNSRIPFRESKLKMADKCSLGRSRKILKTKYGKSGHRYMRNAYGRTKKNGEGFFRR